MQIDIRLRLLFTYNPNEQNIGKQTNKTSKVSLPQPHANSIDPRERIIEYILVILYFMYGKTKII